MACTRTLLWLGLALLATVMLPGCSGCRQDPLVERKRSLEDEEKKKEKPKEDFEFQIPHTVPTDESLAASWVKPGHWVTVAHDVKANNFNFQAELHTMATDRDERPFEVKEAPYILTSSRPAPLPKGQARRFETIYFTPIREPTETRTPGFHRELRAARGGRLLKKDFQPLLEMPAYQYFFLVLAGDPDRYGYVKRLTSVDAPTAHDPEKETYLYYRVLLPKLERIAPLPSNPLTWSSLACILWDDADPNILTPDQRRAMLDWLHWGGQLIISGPNSLEKLNGTFLEEYLPAKAARTIEIDQAAIDDLNQHWALRNLKEGGQRTLELLPGQPLVGIELSPQAPGEFVPLTGELLAERRLGAGRIVVTAFSLTDRALLKWTSFDSFFNACLLRRPPRQFSYRDLLDMQWRDDPMAATDTRYSTTLRYFSRDIGHYASDARPAGYVEPGEEAAAVTMPTPDASVTFQPVSQVTTNSAPAVAVERRETYNDDWHRTGFPQRDRLGMAAWNDHSGAADAAREALKVAKGFSIPKGDFVLQVLLVYLLVLAPLNWGLFRLIGRVEWAWVAAPVLAILGTIAVVRLAQLDIGFARSETELAIAEVQGDYPRAHVTRYTSMYTSLSSSYDVVFEDEASLAQPFGKEAGFQRGPYEPVHTVSLRRDRELRLSGFQVRSNDTATVHCEQMTDLGGSFRLSGDSSTGYQVANGSSLNFHGVGLLRRTEQGVLERAWLGEFPAGAILPLRFEPARDNEARCPLWDEAPATFSFERQARLLLSRHDADGDGQLKRAEVASHRAMTADFDRFDLKRDGVWEFGELLSWCRGSRSGELSLGRFVDLASEGLHLRRGDVRLIGWTEEALPGIEIRPISAQEVRQTLLLVHLQRGPLSAPRPDVNCAADFVLEPPKAEGEGAVPANGEPTGDAFATPN